ncbi:Homocysteine S-methyltransferase [Streptomyces sp. ADI98-12]|nr:Homocysteine S-methyltransferase [Streptomyces sp. ADI98-12]
MSVGPAGGTRPGRGRVRYEGRVTSYSVGSGSFVEEIGRRPVVVDGGLSEQLAARGHDLSDALWSARLLADAPGEVVAAHRAYYAAGAEVAITASYQATFEGFARRGTGRAATVRLLTASVELARRAAAEARAYDGVSGPLWVAASAGPYGAMLADGSEYRGRYGLSVAELERFHRPRLEVLAAAGPDVLALETVPDADEGRALLRAARGLGVPAWLSYSVVGDRTRAGDRLADAFAPAADAPEVLAVGVNCCDPRDVEPAVRLAARVTGKPVVAYPNSGERWDPAARDWRGPAQPLAGLAERWVAAGARLVGGCCRVGTESVRELASAVRRQHGRRP